MAYYKEVTTVYTPSSGNTVNIPAFDSDVMCCFIDSGALGVLNINLPLGCRPGQAIRIFFKGAITLLGITVTGGTLVGTLASILGGASVVYGCRTDGEWWKG